MSEYSGKCDLCDDYEMSLASGRWDFKRTKIYIGDNIIPLRIDREKDLIPYFPYLIGIEVSTNDLITIKLSERSFVDREEEECLEFYLKNVLRYWNKCKRDKKEFDDDYCLKYYCNNNKEIMDRVKNFGKKATINGIHLPMHERYRDKLYNKMLEAGYEETQAYRWVYGWDRYFERLKEKKSNDN